MIIKIINTQIRRDANPNLCSLTLPRKYLVSPVAVEREAADNTCVISGKVGTRRFAKPLTCIRPAPQIKIFNVLKKKKFSSAVLARRNGRPIPVPHNSLRKMFGTVKTMGPSTRSVVCSQMHSAQRGTVPIVLCTVEPSCSTHFGLSIRLGFWLSGRLLRW